MSAITVLKRLVLKNPERFGADSTKTPTKTSSKGSPFLDARRTWNDNTRALVSQLQTWQLIGCISLMMCLGSLGGFIWLSQQTKFIPFVVEVDKHGNAVSRGPADKASALDDRVVIAAIRDFISKSRMVTPDATLQRNAVLDVYAMLRSNDPAMAKMNDYLNGTPDSNPFKRAETVMVHANDMTVLQQSKSSWQIDWTETTRDRQGILLSKRPWRALVTIYHGSPPSGAEDPAQDNPNSLGLYVKNFSWARLPD